MVKPGDTLELHVEVIAKKMNMYKFHGIAMVSGKKGFRGYIFRNYELAISRISDILPCFARHFFRCLNN